MKKQASIFALTLGMLLLIGQGCGTAATETADTTDAGTAEVESAVLPTAGDDSVEEAEETDAAEETTTDTAVEEVETAENVTVVEDADAGLEEPTTTTDSSALTAENVATHNSASDCWMIINDVVYDVTDYISSHPGGSVITRGCGIDATTLFETQGGGGSHSALADAQLTQYELGPLE